MYVSTSLDGPKDLHDMNRPLQNKELDHHVIFEKNPCHDTANMG